MVVGLIFLVLVFFSNPVLGLLLLVFGVLGFGTLALPYAAF